MSKETMEWLNLMTLVGFTEERGKAWTYAAGLQGDEPNHYPGAIPVADVIRRLFSFEAMAVDLTYTYNGETRTVPNAKLWIASDDGSILATNGASAIHAGGYAGHDYAEWLVTNVESILNGSLGIGSAGLLRSRGQAWVSVEVPKNLTTKHGVDFRPRLLATTSFDGSLATTYKETAGIVVCDNTRDMALAGAGAVFRTRHTKNSGLKIESAREALGILETLGERFQAETDALCETKVSPKAFARTLDILIPITGADGKPLEGRGLTFAESKRDQISALYAHDDRVAPWAGTAFGVLQAWNTYEHHFAIRRGEASRVQRNAEYALTGKMAELDAEVMSALGSVLAS